MVVARECRDPSAKPGDDGKPGRDRRGDDIAKRYDKPLTPEELAALPDAAVDTSDIPPLGPEFRRNARVAMPGEGKRQD